MTAKLSAVVIGLGRVGARFDEEAGRKVVWTHAGAYRACADRFELAGACDPDSANRVRFQARFPTVPVFADVDSLLAQVQPEVGSICTPSELHGAVLDKVLSSPRLRVVWCEKPLSPSLAEAETMCRRADERNVVLVVSHVRRWTPLWQRAHALVADGAVGRVRSIRIAMPNRLWSVGSHAVDLLLYFGGEYRVIRPLLLPALAEDGEPAVAALVAFAGGAYGIVQVTGAKRALMVEAEIVGDGGRLHVREDQGMIRLERFLPSASYADYDQLAQETVERQATLTEDSPFVAIAAEIAEIAAHPGRKARCGAREALEVQRALAAISAAAQSHPVVEVEA